MLDEFQFNLLQAAIICGWSRYPCDNKKDVIEIIVEYSLHKPEMSIRIKAEENLSKQDSYGFVQKYKFHI